MSERKRPDHSRVSKARRPYWVDARPQRGPDADQASGSRSDKRTGTRLSTLLAGRGWHWQFGLPDGTSVNSQRNDDDLSSTV